jgi:hypothetical protein
MISLHLADALNRGIRVVVVLKSISIVLYLHYITMYSM